MKKFFSKLAVAVGCLGLVLIPFSYANQKEEVALLSNVKPFPKNTTILALGDSHIECSLDPDYFEGMANRATSGEAVLYTLAKLKFFKERNPQIETLILSYDYFLLGEWRRIGTHGKLTNSMYPRFMPLLKSQPGMLNELSDNFFSGNFIASYLGLPTKRLFNKSIHSVVLDTEDGHNFEGGFITGFKADVDRADVEKKVKEHFGSFDSNRPLAYNGVCQIELFHKMMTYCKEQNIKIVLFNAPTHAKYNELIPIEIVRSVDSIAYGASKQYGAVYINLYNYHLPDSMYRDHDHINTEGAKIITPMLRDTLQKLGVIR